MGGWDRDVAPATREGFAGCAGCAPGVRFPLSPLQSEMGLGRQGCRLYSIPILPKMYVGVEDGKW